MTQSPPKTAVLLRYHEIALKGGNRGWFEDRLAINARRMIKRALGSDTQVETELTNGRILIYTEWNNQVAEALGRLFGAASFSPMRLIPTDLESFKREAIEEARTLFAKHPAYAHPPTSFRILTKRSDKVLPQTSMEIDREVGSAVWTQFPHLEVELEEPTFRIGIEVRRGHSYIWSDKYAGLGGLPVGSNGSLLALLSGGLDSPIAAIQALKRGTAVSFLHFYGAPFVGEEVLEKVEDLARIVNRYQPDPRPLFVIPFGKIQEKIALATNAKLRTVLYRRMMVRIACEVARKSKSQALVTGEALGQVASQTLENLSTINAVAELPILRPLITWDKDEIVKASKIWGTFETAIRPGVDCCTLFADRHPAVKTTIPLIEEEEAKFPVQDLVQEAMAGLLIRRVV